MLNNFEVGIHHNTIASILGRPQGIMLQILLIMLFRISLKIPHYAHYYSFYACHCYYYSIVPIVNNTMHKCCNVKLQVVFDEVSSGIVL